MISLTRTYSVLIVEDNPDDVFLIQQAFEQCGYPCQLSIVESHEEAYRSLAAESFDLFVSDFGSNSPQAGLFLQGVRKQFPRLPVVIFSGSCDHDAAYETGANAFVRKQPDLDQLFAKIAGIARFWLGVAELPSRPSGLPLKPA